MTDLPQLKEEYKLEEEISRLKLENTKIWDNVKILIAKTSHEIKTPLNSIIGFSELFKCRTDDIKMVEYIDNILISSKHLLSLAENLIDITKPKDNPIKLVYSIFNTKNAINEVINSFQKGDIKSTIIDTTICADHTRFKQLIYNLISNALKYNKKGKPAAVITYIEDDSFCFEVTDYGEGIEEDNQDKIFEFFTQVSEDINKRQIGSGIGLAICKIITDAHGGDIFVVSKKDEGSTFGFKIPISPNNSKQQIE